MATNLLVCLVLFAAASAVPVVRDDFDSQSDIPSYQCARQCKGSQAKFHYERGMTYIYEYKAEAETSVAGASEDKAKMYIEAQAKIEVIDQCEFALRMSDVKISHSEPNSDSMKPAENAQEFQRALVENTLRFSFDDGIIRDVCHASQEKVWVLNFKRGLLSAFQNSMDDLEKDQTTGEIDVTGECQAEYIKKKEWLWQRSIKLAKSKNLQACYKHSGVKSLIPMVPYKVPSEIQSLPIMKSTHDCDIIVSPSRILESSVCKESHVFAPFSNHQSGGATKVQQTLKFVSSRRGVETREGDVQVRSDLLFKHMNGIDEVQNSKRVAQQELMAICEQTKYDIRPETPRLFNEIVMAVKAMDSSDLHDLYTMIKDNRYCRQNQKAVKFLLDALPIAGTKGALDLMAEVINDNEIPDLEKSAWLTSLSLIPEPTEDMLPALLILLNGQYADQSLLPVSSLLNTMCRKNVDCDHSYLFKRVVNKINENIDSTCSSNDKAKVMKTLRAIGNIGYSQDLLSTLNTCLTARYAPLEVKVAAIDAYRRFGCQDNEDDGKLMQIFEAKNADSEIRIMSFLSLMRCPRDSVLQKIADQLRREEDKHVGTFVYTHLENLKQTSDPHKQDIADAVKRLDLKPFEDTSFRTSRCHESSVLINKLNLGYVADGDLIWSDNSMVPRAMRVNLTVEMFGNSINFFEAGARMDGVDRFVQKYFGHEGYFSQNQASSDDLEAFIYARMFGNEVFFKHMKGSEEHEKIKNYFNFEKLLENLSKDYDYKYIHSQQLMDQSLIIPTIIGLPVNMTVNSSVVFDTETSGKIDFSGVLSRSRPITVTNNFAVSAGLEVTGSMMVDAMVYKQGVRMRNTLHSSVSTKSTLKIVNRQIVDFEIRTPDERQEIVNARSQFFIVHDNVEKEQEMIKENRREMNGCTGEIFSKVTGVELCGELAYPNASMVEDAPYFPLTGPIKAALVMQKKDTHTSYKIFAKWIKNSRKLEAQLQLNTPGSQVDRHISSDITIGYHRNSHVDLVFISPWKKIVLNSKVAMDDSLTSLTGDLLIDDSKQYKLTTEMKTKEIRHGLEFTPLVEVENAGQRITLMKGTVIYSDRVLAQLELQDLERKQYALESRLINTAEEKRIALSAGKKGENPYRFQIGSVLKVSGRQNQNVEIDPELVIQAPEGDIVAFKTFGEFQPKPLKFVGNMTFNSALIGMEQPSTLEFNMNQRRKKYPFTGKLTYSIGSTITADLNGEVEVSKNAPKAVMTLTYRNGEKKEVVTFLGKLQNKSRASYAKYIAKSNLKFKTMPEYNTDSIMKINSKNSKTTVDVNVKFTNRPRNTRRRQPDIQVHLSTDIENMKQAQIHAELKAKMPEKNMDVKMQFNHEHNLQRKKLESKVNLHLVPFVENDINADISIQDKGRNLYDVTALGNLEAYGEKYNLKSELLQKSRRRFEHSITITGDQQQRHSMVTVYKKTNDRYEVNTDIESSRLEQPLGLQVSADLKESTDFHIRGALNENSNELYFVDALSKLEDSDAGKWNLELAHPERKVKAQVDFTKVNNRIDTNALLNWDVRSQQRPAPEVRITGQFTHRSDSDSLLLKTNIKLNTPFESMEKLSSNWNLEKSETVLKSMGQIAYNDRPKFASRLTAKLPFSIENADVTFLAKTPYDNFKDVKVVLEQKIDSEIKTHLKAKFNKDLTEVNIKGTKDFTDSSRSIHGEVTMKTPYSSFKHVDVKFDHNDDENKIETTAQIKKDGKGYNLNLDYSRDTRRSQTARVGKLNLAGPERSAETSFSHTLINGRHELEASLRSGQNNRRNSRYSVDVTGSYQHLSRNSLNVNVKTPLRRARTVGLEINNLLDQSQLKSKIVFELNRFQTGYFIELKNRPQDKSLDIMFSPGMIFSIEYPLHFTSKLQYENHPLTVSGQMGWSPSSVIGFVGSCNAQNLDDLELSMKLTTPFENMENIELLASHGLKNSVRVSHINLDYGVRKMIDIEVNSQNDEDKKVLRLKVIVPSDQFQSLDTGVDIDLRRGVFAKSNIELHLAPEEKYEGTVSLKVDGIDNIRGKVNIKTPVEGLEQIEGTFVRNGRRGDNTNKLTLTNSGDKLIDIKAETEVERHRVNIKIITQGKLLPYLMEAVDELHIFPKMHEDNDGNMIQRLINVIEIKEQEPTVQIDGSVTSDYGRNEEKISSTMRITCEKMSDIDVYASLSHNSDKVQGYFVVKVTDDVEFKALVTDLFGGKHGIEYTQSSNSYKGVVYFHEIRKFESSFELYVSSIKHIEFTSMTKTDIRGYELTKVKYTHEGQDNRASCSLSVEDVKEIKASIDLVAQNSPVHLFSLIVKTPYNDYNKMIISGDYDQTKINALLQLNDDQQISLSGVYDNYKNPKFTLKTPLRLLQVLFVNVNGDLLDGSSSFTLKFNDDDQIDGNIAIKYASRSDIQIMAQLKPRIDQSERDMKFELELTQNPKRTHFLVAADDENMIKFDTRVTEVDEVHAINHYVDIELKFEALGIDIRRLVFSGQGGKGSGLARVRLFGQSETVIDAELNVDMVTAMKATVTIREPKHMEYTFTQENFPDSNENELNFNWDKNNPEASFIVRATQKGEFTSGKIVKSMTLRFSCPSRTVGVEHSVTITRGKAHASGKVYWNDDSESQLAYDLELNDQSNRRKSSYDGQLKVKLPTRTVGVAAYAKDDSDKQQAGATFSWNMEKDARKKIGVDIKVQKESYTQADVSLILPEDAHVDSKLVMNKGNTILEGQTQIFYSQDSGKTLTLFSKLENNPEQSSYFYSSENNNYNYSIQLGLSHPDSNVDVKMVSHLGLDSDRVTTSVGIDYLNSRRQTKNLDLFVEINKLKKEINLHAATPYKNFGLVGSIKENPMELKAITTVDNQRAISASVLVDQSQKKIQFDYTNDDKELHYSAGFPNRTAVLFQREKREDGNVEREVKLLIQLVTPQLLRSDLEWKPGMIKDMRDMIFDTFKQSINGLISLSDEISTDVKAELKAKYEAIKLSVIDDLRNAVIVTRSEIMAIQSELDKMERNLQNDFNFCDFEIGDFELKQEIVRLQRKLQSQAEDINAVVKDYTQSYRNALGDLLNKIESLRELPFDQAYEYILREISWIEAKLFNTFFWDIMKMLKEVSPELLEKIWKYLHEIIERQYDPQVIIDELNKGMEYFKNVKTTSLITKMTERNLEFVSKLKIIIRKLSDFVSEHPITQQAADILEKNANELYQVAKWSIKYLEIDNKLPEHLDTAIDYINEIIEEELKENLGPVYRYIRNPVTRFDPVHGIITAEIPLPIQVDRLDRIPSILEASKKIAELVQREFGNNTYLPHEARRPVVDARPQRQPLAEDSQSRTVTSSWLDYLSSDDQSVDATNEKTVPGPTEKSSWWNDLSFSDESSDDTSREAVIRRPLWKGLSADDQSTIDSFNQESAPQPTLKSSWWDNLSIDDMDDNDLTMEEESIPKPTVKSSWWN